MGGELQLFMPELHIVHAGDVVDGPAEQDAEPGAVQIPEPLTPAHLEHQSIAAQGLPEPLPINKVAALFAVAYLYEHRENADMDELTRMLRYDGQELHRFRQDQLAVHTLLGDKAHHAVPGEQLLQLGEGAGPPVADVVVAEIAESDGGRPGGD